MAKLTVEHQDEILTFPVDTILDLKIEECNSETIQGRNGSWSKLKFKFKILGIQALGDGSQNLSEYENWITKDIWGSVPEKLTDSPENRLRIWAEAIFKTELGLGFELDTDMFVGRLVRGLTSQYDAKGRGSGGEAFKRHQIETLLPAGGHAAAAPQPAMAVSQNHGNGSTATWTAPAAPGPVADPWAAAPAAADPWASTLGSSDEPPF